MSTYALATYLLNHMQKSENFRGFFGKKFNFCDRFKRESWNLQQKI